MGSCRKEGILWVRWVHGRYIKGKSWWDLTPAPDGNWYWKKICQVKDIFKQNYVNQSNVEWQGTPVQSQAGRQLVNGGGGKGHATMLMRTRITSLGRAKQLEAVYSQSTIQPKFDNGYIETKCTKGDKLTTSAIISTAIYPLWSARNQATFNNKLIPPKQAVNQIKEQVRYRILHLNTISNTYKKCVDRLLQ
ncbi:hypothetical protein Cgig2_033665 [Carnegiea gigantea]|uniref:Uncharacterized protein n=1 Tax=Carnegiea gigantea TaxID=171969 RepID=A0A9Q1JGP1_9CARY|nr:hypothetical protein Cgig2_033665 [Carnegiea gigantea]